MRRPAAAWPRRAGRPSGRSRSVPRKYADDLVGRAPGEGQYEIRIAGSSSGLRQAQLGQMVRHHHDQQGLVHQVEREHARSDSAAPGSPRLQVLGPEAQDGATGAHQASVVAVLTKRMKSRRPGGGGWACRLGRLQTNVAQPRRGRRSTSAKAGASGAAIRRARAAPPDLGQTEAQQEGRGGHRVHIGRRRPGSGFLRSGRSERPRSRPRNRIGQTSRARTLEGAPRPPGVASPRRRQDRPAAGRPGPQVYEQIGHEPHVVVGG